MSCPTNRSPAPQSPVVERYTRRSDGRRRAAIPCPVPGLHALKPWFVRQLAPMKNVFVAPRVPADALTFGGFGVSVLAVKNRAVPVRRAIGPRASLRAQGPQAAVPVGWRA